MNSVKIKRVEKVSPRKKAVKLAPKRAYHHGDLREKLVAATEALIRERGVDGFSLREVARRAGVSPAAPAHHFGDARGLLSEVALLGFQEFGDALAAGDALGGSDPAARLYEQGKAYVNFALKNPARFQLMFSNGKCDPAYKNLDEISNRSFRVLEKAIRAAMGLTGSDEMPPDGYGYLMAVWSCVHGFAHLALGGQFDGPAQMRGMKGEISKTFLPLMLAHLPEPPAQKTL